MQSLRERPSTRVGFLKKYEKLYMQQIDAYASRIGNVGPATLLTTEDASRILEQHLDPACTKLISITHEINREIRKLQDKVDQSIERSVAISESVKDRPDVDLLLPVASRMREKLLLNIYHQLLEAGFKGDQNQELARQVPAKDAAALTFHEDFRPLWAKVSEPIETLPGDWNRDHLLRNVSRQFEQYEIALAGMRADKLHLEEILEEHLERIKELESGQQSGGTQDKGCQTLQQDLMSLNLEEHRNKKQATTDTDSETDKDEEGDGDTMAYFHSISSQLFDLEVANSKLKRSNHDMSKEILRMYALYLPDITDASQAPLHSYIDNTLGLTRAKTVLKLKAVHAVNFATTFDPEIMLQPKFTVLTLALFSEELSRGLDSDELLTQRLLWFSKDVDFTLRIRDVGESRLLVSVMEQIVDARPQSLSNSLLHMLAANFAQRGCPRFMYLVLRQILGDHTSGKQLLESYTILEQITFLWLTAINGSWPKELEEAQYPDLHHLWRALYTQRDNAKDFVKLLELSSHFLSQQEDVEMLVLYPESDLEHVMIILGSTSLVNRWEYIFVRYHESVTFTTKGLRFSFDVAGSLWGQPLTLTSLWFCFDDRGVQEYVTKFHTEQLTTALEHSPGNPYTE